MSKKLDAAFVQGFAAACAALARDHDEPTVTAMILNGSGINLRDLVKAKVDEFDLAPLRKVLREEVRRGSR